MRLAVIVCVGVLFAPPARAQSSDRAPQESPTLRLTEREAVARFLSSDPRVRALSLRIDEVRATQAERTSWPNPSATFSS